MKNRKRLIVYSLLALPLVVFGMFFLTLDPMARSNFFYEFKTNIAIQFGLKDEDPGVNSDAEQPARENGPRERPEGRGRFDPAQMFADRDTNGDGKLSGDEISERMRENLPDFDQDGDEAITLEELQAGFEQRRASFRGGRPRDGEGDAEDDGEGKDEGEEASEGPQRPE